MERIIVTHPSQGLPVGWVINDQKNGYYIKILQQIGPQRYVLGTPERDLAVAFQSKPWRDLEVRDMLNAFGPQILIENYEANTQTESEEAKKSSGRLDISHLSKLVLDKEAKDEIVSVLKQYHHKEKLFKEWGLDEVIQYGKGMTFLFYGLPGTGKTWAANLIAKCLGQELLVISPAEIQSSEPGAANRNLQNAFRIATSQKKVLFIDECDSLITMRDQVGMIIGGEINTLLTEIEKFEGVAVLTTNRVDTLDEALERRISLIVEFPEPKYDERKDIWEKLLPKKMPLASDVKVDKLAEYKLTGGQIKNCILQAARLALAEEKDKVSMHHFEKAISRVIQSKSLLGTASRFQTAKMREDAGIGRSAGKLRDKVKSDDVDVDIDVHKSRSKEATHANS